MKDYRRYTKPYTPEEWEQDMDWLAKRLEFLWTLRDYYPQLYVNKGFGDEKEDIYRDCEEIVPIASKLHYSQYNLDKKKFKDMNQLDLFRDFEQLKYIKDTDMDMFLRKRLYIKYYYMNEVISDSLNYEYQEFLNERMYY